MSEESFQAFDLDSRIMQALAKMNIYKPTLIQSSAIPLALSGKDIVARARTGSGKTAAYCLPIVNTLLKSEKIGVRAVILVPTKELASQVRNFLHALLIFCPSFAFVYNLIDIDSSSISKTECNQILVSTPSKLIHHLESKLFSISETMEFIVIDEADLILSFGYQSDIENIQKRLPRIYQSFFMSATLTPELEKLKKLIVRNPAIIKLEDGDSDDLLKQYFVRCESKDKFLVLFFIIKLKVHPFGDAKTIIFVNDIDQCYRLKLFFEQFGIRACVLNSELPLKSRLHIVEEFNRGAYNYIIATDQGDALNYEKDSEDEDTPKIQVDAGDTSKKSTKSKHKRVKNDKEYGSSRGLDFKNVQAVINFDLPSTSRSYMHRVGRTARGLGNEGFSLSFVVTDTTGKVEIKPKLNEDGEAVSRDEYMMKRIEKKQTAMGRQLKQFKFDMAYIEGFKYRVEDGLRAVTKIAIRDARVKEIKSEIINSEKLKSHFEDNPKDLEALKHDKVLHPSRVQPHLRHIPSYLVPKKGSTKNKISMGEDGENVSKKRKRFSSKSFKKNDPLKTFKA